MKPPRIDWDYKHQPSNRDEMMPLGEYEIDGHTVLVAINCTTNKLFFAWDESYGVLVSGGE